MLREASCFHPSQAILCFSFTTAQSLSANDKSHTERALRHYVLDGFVTAHVALQQGMSRAYLYLSGFERDNKRRQAMCTRRSVSGCVLISFYALCVGSTAGVVRVLRFVSGDPVRRG